MPRSLQSIPLTLECEVVEMQSQPYGLRVLGKIVNVIADEKVLDEAGKIDAGSFRHLSLIRCRMDIMRSVKRLARPGTAARI